MNKMRLRKCGGDVEDKKYGKGDAEWKNRLDAMGYEEVPGKCPVDLRVVMQSAQNVRGVR